MRPHLKQHTCSLHTQAGLEQRRSGSANPYSARRPALQAAANAAAAPGDITALHACGALAAAAYSGGDQAPEPAAAHSGEDRAVTGAGAGEVRGQQIAIL